MGGTDCVRGFAGCVCVFGRAGCMVDLFGGVGMADERPTNFLCSTLFGHYMIQKGETYKSLSEKCGYSASHLENIVSGYARCSKKLLDKAGKSMGLNDFQINRLKKAQDKQFVKSESKQIDVYVIEYGTAQNVDTDYIRKEYADYPKVSIKHKLIAPEPTRWQRVKAWFGR